MLHVIYEAAEDLAPGRLACIEEGRGEVRIKVDAFEPLHAVIRQLNIEMADFLARADWFQLWGEEILSRHTPKKPLRVEYVLDPTYTAPAPGMAEKRGVVTVYVNPAMTPVEFAASMNPTVQHLLDGGCWFQVYAGEIIDHSPEPAGRA